MKASSSKIAQANSKSGHKNISYQRQNDAYVVSIMRKGYTFFTLCESVEEAIDVRDLVYEFFDKNDRLPSIEEMGLKRGSVSKAKIKLKHHDQEPDYVCKRCNRRFYYDDTRLNDKNNASLFKSRGNICGHCARRKNSPLSVERSDCQSKHKYITVRAIDSGRIYYAVKIVRHRNQMNRVFNNLDQAVRFRNKAIDFYNSNGRLPTHDEQNIIFPERPVRKREFHAPDNRNESQRSKSGLKHISYHKLTNRYNVTVSRNNHKVAVTFKDLDDAIVAREIILDVYHETGQLPTRGEVIAKLDEIKSQAI